MVYEGGGVLGRRCVRWAVYIIYTGEMVCLGGCEFYDRHIVLGGWWIVVEGGVLYARYGVQWCTGEERYIVYRQREVVWCMREMVY